ncbi:hypothetical protein KJ865_07570 [Myxococcota bacterium]|nr:hypothetical protein [Myxococcota bacterium]
METTENHNAQLNAQSALGKRQKCAVTLPRFLKMERMLAMQLLLVLLYAGCSAGGRTKSKKPSEVQTEGKVLGCWAVPKIEAEGSSAKVTGWRTNLWLTDGRTADGRWAYSDATSYRSLVGVAKAPGAFVELNHSGAHAELKTSGSTLTVPGHGPVGQTSVLMYDFPTHQVSTHGLHTYRYHFPAPAPGWPHLDFRVPFKNGSGALNVRFTRDNSRRPVGNSPPSFDCNP